MAAKTATPQPAAKFHNSQSLDLYCETCESLVCRDCVIKRVNHKYGLANEIVEEIINQICTENKKVSPANVQYPGHHISNGSGEQKVTAN